MDSKKASKSSLENNSKSPRENSSLDSISPIEPVECNASYTNDSNCTIVKNNSESITSNPTAVDSRFVSVKTSSRTSNSLHHEPASPTKHAVQYTDAQLLEFLTNGNVPVGYNIDGDTIQRLLNNLDEGKKNRQPETNESNSQLSNPDSDTTMANANNNNNNSNMEKNSRDSDSQAENSSVDEHVCGDNVQKVFLRDQENPAANDGQSSGVDCALEKPVEQELSISEGEISDGDLTLDVDQCAIIEGNTSDNYDSSSENCSVHSSGSECTIPAEPRKRRHRRNRRVVKDSDDEDKQLCANNSEDLIDIPIRLKSTHECLDLTVESQTDQLDVAKAEDNIGDNQHTSADNDINKNLSGNHDNPETSNEIANDDESASLNNSNNATQHLVHTSLVGETETLLNLPTTSTSDNILPDICYSVKWSKFNGTPTPIILQNLNGSCPLLSIANILLLRRDITLKNSTHFVMNSELLNYLADYMMTLRISASNNKTENTLLDVERNTQDSLAMLSQLSTGIDINVKFTGTGDFEFTSECLVFDSVNIRLRHGWIAETMDERQSISSFGYNQLVELIISGKSSQDHQVYSKALIADDFLRRSASQLTYQGIAELVTEIKEEELCAFFRNNHFSVMYKKNGKLYTLVTDQGYRDEHQVVWETLASVDGAGKFVNSNLEESFPSQDIDQDYQLALKLSINENQTTSDFDLAKKLQKEEIKAQALRNNKLKSSNKRKRTSQNTNDSEQSPNSDKPGPSSEPESKKRNTRED